MQLGWFAAAYRWFIPWKDVAQRDPRQLAVVWVG